MRILTYRVDGVDRAGVRTDDGVVDVAEALGAERIDVRELLESGRLEELADAVEAKGREPRSPEGLELRPPVPNPEKIVCIGLNYRSHAAEAGIEPPEAPTMFAKFPNSLAPDGASVPLPESSEKVDFEAEVAFVIGRRCKEVGADEGLDAVAGYMLLNDLSARDLQFATPQWMPGKIFDGSAPCGPALVTPDEAGPHDGIEFELRLNGEVMQRASTSDLIFSVPELVSHLSTLMTLEPGDVVATGTPSGVGSVRDPRIWLKPRDEVVISSPTLGRLETTLA